MSQPIGTTNVDETRRARTPWTFAAVAVILAAAGCFSSSSNPPGSDDGGDDATSADAAGSDAPGDVAIAPGADAGSDASDAGDAPVAVDGSEASPDAGADAHGVLSADGAALVPGPYTINGAVTGQTAPFVLQDDGTDNLDVSATTHSIHFATGLAAGASYDVTVLTQPAGQYCAVADGAGSVGDASVGTVIVSCGIAPPTDLAATPGAASATLTWTAVPGATGYNLYYDLDAQLGQATLGSPTARDVATTGTTTLSTTVTGLLPGAEYYFFVTSEDSQGESRGGSNVVTATSPPLSPIEVTTTAGNGQVTLTWDSVQAAAGGYNLYYATTSSVTGGTKVSGAVSGVPVTGLTDGQLYYFGVTALDAAMGESPVSNVVSATPSASLAASISSVANLGVVHSGAVVGRASGTGITAVQVSLDSGPYAAATGTGTWSFVLPTGASTWREGSAHTIRARATDGTSYSPVATVSVHEGINQDVDRDGYADMIVGSASTQTAWVFKSRGPAGLLSDGTNTADLTFTGPSGTSFGGAVLLADLDSDGYADVIVSDGCSYTAQDVSIFQSSGARVASAASSAATSTLTGPAQTCFGGALAAGDVDGDGYADLVVGAEGDVNPVGNAYVFKSGASGIASGDNTTAAATLTGPTLGCSPACAVDEFGAQVAVGDVNGDGYADVAVSDLQSGGAYDETGAVYIFQSAGSAGIGTRTYASAQATVTGPGPADSASGGSGQSANFGATMAMGDLNGDGYADLVVGAAFSISTNPSYWEYALGSVYAFESAGSTGIASATFSSAQVTLSAPLPSYCCDGVELGDAVTVGDVNGDGYADIIASTRLSNTLYVFQSQGGAPVASTSISGATTTMSTPTTITSTAVIDVNGDGFADVVAAGGDGLYVLESVGTGAIPSGALATANAVYSFAQTVVPAL